MNPSFRIALRFLFSRKRSMLMSLAGIAFGVGFFIVTQAQTSGFEQFYIRTIVGTDSPLRVEDRLPASSSASGEAGGGEGDDALSAAQLRAAQVDASLLPAEVIFAEGIEYPAQLRQAVLDYEQVSAVSAIVRGEATAESGFARLSVQVHGIDLADHLRVTSLADEIIDGSLDAFMADGSAVLLASRLATRLGLRAGDVVLLGNGVYSSMHPVAGIFESGVDQIDRRRVFMHTEPSRVLLKQPWGVTLFQVGLHDLGDADWLAQRMQAQLGYRVIGWPEREKSWLQVFSVLRLSSAVTVSIIILIAGLGMFNTLAMAVLEKTREIAILRSIGYSQRDIRRIFLWQGGLIFAVGTLLGWGIGAGMTFALSRLPVRIRGIFSTDTFAVSWDFSHYLWAALVAAVVVFVASYIPARRAAALEPGSVIRGNAS